MPKLNDITREILGRHYGDVSSYLSNPFNLPSLSSSGLVTMADARRAATNPNITDPTELKILRGRTNATRAILDSGVSVDSYYDTLTRFYSTPAGRALGPELDRWARNPNVTQAEITAMSRRVFTSARDGMSREELASIRRDMDLQDNPTVTTGPTGGGREAQPQPPQAITQRELNQFNANRNVTDNEQEYFRRTREENARGGRTADEIREERRLMDRLDNRGEQLTAAQIRTLPGQGQPRVDRRDDPPAEEPAVAAQQVDAPLVVEEPAVPVRYSPPDRLDAASYDTLMLTLGGHMRQLMPEGMGNGLDMDGFLENLEDPAFRDRFIELYNTDPQYRESIQSIYRNADRLAQVAERHGGGALDPNTPAGRQAGLLQGQFRTLISNPEDLLDVNRVLELRGGLSNMASMVTGLNGLTNSGGMMGWLGGSTMGICGMFFDAIKACFQGGVGGGLNDLLSGMGINLAGNNGGANLANLNLQDIPIIGDFLGGGAGDSPQGPQLAAVDPQNRNLQQQGPNLGLNGPGGGPVLGSG